MLLLVKLYSWGQENKLILKRLIMALNEFSNPYFPRRSDISFSPIRDTHTFSETCYIYIYTHMLFVCQTFQIHANLIEATIQTYQGLKQANFLM